MSVARDKILINLPEIQNVRFVTQKQVAHFVGGRIGKNEHPGSLL
jgi:hypothetical protein